MTSILLGFGIAGSNSGYWIPYLIWIDEVPIQVYTDKHLKANTNIGHFNNYILIWKQTESCIRCSDTCRENIERWGWGREGGREREREREIENDMGEGQREREK